jgi:anti-sigma factor RsiW
MLSAGHRRVRRAVDAYVDGELTRGRAAAVAAHLAECWGCSGDADTLRLVKRSLQGRATRRPSDLALARMRRWAEGLARP